MLGYISATSYPVILLISISFQFRNKLSLVYVSSCGNTGPIKGDPYENCKKSSLELIGLFITKFVYPVVTLDQ